MVRPSVRSGRRRLHAQGGLQFATIAAAVLLHAHGYDIPRLGAFFAWAMGLATQTAIAFFHAGHLVAGLSVLGLVAGVAISVAAIWGYAIVHRSRSVLETHDLSHFQRPIWNYVPWRKPT